MDINPSVTNVIPADVKSQGNSALQEGQAKKVDDAVAKLEITKQKELAAEKQVSSEKKVDSKELDVAIAKLNDNLQVAHKNLAFSVHEESGRDVVSILDTKSHEVIKQYPSEEVLKLAAELSELVESGASMEQAFNIFTSEA
jgi:flagellar protein FlaG